MRRAFLTLTACALLTVSALVCPATRPDAFAAAAVREVEPKRFLEFAYSLAVLQARASELAAKKDTRPEVKRFANEMTAFRTKQIERIQAVSVQGVKPSLELLFEHRILLQNLEPLDFLAFSRRYIEMQVQALEQEISAYHGVNQGAQPSLKRLSDEVLPELGRWLDAAQKAF